MASVYTSLKQGARGDSVKELQKLLNQSGYSLAEDGIYGTQTAAAVNDYKTKNNMAADGVADEATWTKLTGGTQQATVPEAATAGIAGVSDNTTQKLTGYEAGYRPSNAVAQAQSYLSQLQNNAPAPYQSSFDQQIQDIYGKIMGRDDFTYNLNADMLYNQYKDQYTNLGQMAMMDTQGQAAGLTGGYGSSYAQGAGQQAYGQYMQQLNNVVPDLYNAAYSRYQAEGDQLYNQYALAAQQQENEYGQYQDNLNRYYQDVGMAQDQYNQERELDYGQYADQLSYWNTKAQQENQDYYNQMSLQESPSGGGGGGGSSGGSGGKPPTDDMRTSALDKYNKGGIEAIAADMDYWQMLGYDVDWLLQYLLQYGKNSAPYTSPATQNYSVPNVNPRRGTVTTYTTNQ